MRFWPPQGAALIAMILMLIGVVMLFAGKGGVRIGEQIGLIILGLMVLALVFGLVVNRAL